MAQRLRRDGPRRASAIARTAEETFQWQQDVIDATHPEKTGWSFCAPSRVEEFVFDSANRSQPRGNIYLAKVTRVEPRCQAPSSLRR